MRKFTTKRVDVRGKKGKEKSMKLKLYEIGIKAAIFRIKSFISPKPTKK